MSQSPKAQEDAPSIFDAHHPPPSDVIDDCVHCGFCLPTCPTYALWGEEMDSPRGRIYLMKAGQEGAIRMSETFVRHMDQCLGCMACVTACPSGVQYNKLIEATRPQIERRFSRSFGDQLFRQMIFSLFPRPDRLRRVAWLLWFYQASGFQWLLRHSRVLNLLPGRIKSMEALLPSITRKDLRTRFPNHVPANGTKRLRVGLLLGCVQRVFFPEVNEATTRVLVAEGCEVVIPPEQGCCGALMLHAGEEEDAIALAKKTIDIFEGARVDVIAINAAGCGSSMKEYGWLLRDDLDYAEKAQQFSAKCKDISEILMELGPRAERHPMAVKAAYHDACHLQHVQGIRAQPRDLLRSIPKLELEEIAESALCCGSAGVFNLMEPATAQELGDRKVRNVLTTGAEILVTGNPGCLLQIQAGMKRVGRSMPAYHWIELLDASIRGSVL